MVSDGLSRAPHPLRSRWLFLLPGLSLLAGLALTLVLALLAHHAYSREEARLLHLRVRDGATVLSEAVTPITDDLVTASVLADATRGRPDRLKRLIDAEILPTGPFAAMTVWERRDGRAHLLLRAEAPGQPTTANPNAARIAAGLKPGALRVVDLLDASTPHLGYGYAGKGSPTSYAILADTLLSPHRRATVASSSAFAGFSYAIYLNQARPADLIATSARHLPLAGETASSTAPFGTARMIVVFAAHQSLAGELARDLPWIIAIGGVLVSVLVAVGVLRLLERRRSAEQLAGALETTARENERLYAEQRTIAQTLQHALLPDRLPQRANLEAQARYEAGVRSIEIGGDWYDLLELPDDRLLLVVGDVSGRGLRAATVMASLRYAIHAYASEGMAPERILGQLSRLLSLAEHGQLATVLLACVDLEQRSITLASAGHLPPLLVTGQDARYLEVPAQLPVGIDRDPTYHAVSAALPPQGTLLAFTDGLVERRGEDLDAGLARLAGHAARTAASDQLDAVLSNLVAELVDGHDDDIAIVGLRWTS